MPAPSPVKSLDAKLAKIRANPSCGEFILADAKDADMGLGIAAPGLNPGSDQPFRSLAEYRQAMREIVRQGLVDIMLMSPSSGEQLVLQEDLFQNTSVTPAVRANDATDIWLAQSGRYSVQPSLPFQTVRLSELADISRPIVDRRIDLGLYSITLNNDAKLDRDTLSHYRAFRQDAAEIGFRHFLEVFAPNAPVHPIDDVPRFVSDSIARLLAGVVSAARPLFLKMPYFGPGPLESLCHYDPSLVVGVLGGPAGTTYDAFRLVEESKKYGARAALFGRKINQAEDQLAFVRYLRAVADEQITAEEATRAYHGELMQSGRRPRRSLQDDLLPTDPLFA